MSAKKRSIKNKTKKRAPDDRCGDFFNAYDTFEDKVEAVFKKNGVDFLSTNYSLEKQLLKAHKMAVSPSNINPRRDFYTYINERWIKDYSVDENQKYIVQVDDFRLVQDKVYNELLEITDDYIKNNNTAASKCIGRFYDSMKKFNTHEQSRAHASTTLKQIDNYRADKDNLWKMLAYVNSNEIVSWGAPFSWTLNPDDKEPTIYRCYLDAPQVSLIDINVYFDDGLEVEYKRKYKATFIQYVKDLFENTFGKNHGFNAMDVFNVEFKLINAMGCNIIKKYDENGYNVIKAKDAIKDFGFDWVQFTKALGFKYTPEFFITSNPNYMLCGTQLLLEEWTSEEWRTYWIYLFIRQQQRFNKKGHEIHYNFHGKFVIGQEKEVDMSLFPVYGMGYAFNTFFTNEYIKKFENKQRIEYVKTMAEDLKTVFVRILKRNKWLQPRTKEMALKKLYNLKLDVGSPKSLRIDPLLDYTDNDMWGNLVKTAQWRHHSAIGLEGKKVIDIPVIDWSLTPPKFIGSQAYVVNACYTPSSNSIYIPQGYIQKPFVDLEERGIEYNLSRVGYTLAHEMSHALDDWGSKYDDTGKLKNWWADKDWKYFKRIQRDVIKQYEVFASYDGIKFDAEPSIGEDLADISGLTICREYLRDFQLKNEDTLPIQRLSFEAFFVYFAEQQRQQISKKAINAQLKTNPHPLDKYRTNVPLSRLPIFRTIYNIKKGDKMWWHSTNRVWEE
jgi:putative endopeptidase